MIPLQKDKKEVFIMKNKIFVMKVVFNMPPPHIQTTKICFQKLYQFDSTLSGNDNKVVKVNEMIC